MKWQTILKKDIVDDVRAAWQKLKEDNLERWLNENRFEFSEGRGLKVGYFHPWAKEAFEEQEEERGKINRFSDEEIWAEVDKKIKEHGEYDMYWKYSANDILAGLDPKLLWLDEDNLNDFRKEFRNRKHKFIQNQERESLIDWFKENYPNAYIGQHETTEDLQRRKELLSSNKPKKESVL